MAIDLAHLPMYLTLLVGGGFVYVGFFFFFFGTLIHSLFNLCPSFP
jgi:hypothetical protein